MEAWPRRPWAGAARVRLRGDAGGRMKPGHKDPAPRAPHVHTHALLLTLAQRAAGGILLPPAATSALQSPAASQARPQTPGSRFRVGNPDSNSSERTHMPPSMQRGTGGDGQHPVPTRCSDLRVLGSVGQGNLLGTETRQFPGGRELRQGKALPKASPLAKQLISSGLFPPAHRGIVPYRLAAPRGCQLAVDAALEGSPGEALGEAPAGSHPPLPILYGQIQLICGETGTTSAR